MNYIKDINSFITEAISMKMYKENLPKELWYDKSDGYKNWDNLFGKGVNRISIPLKNNSLSIPDSTPLMEEINEVFIPLGYKINSFSDYLNNKVYKIGDTKNPMKIGGLLNKVDIELFKRYDTSIERKEWKDKINNSDKDLKVVISRHPYDLLGMSSGRDWRLSSCMRLGTKDDKVYKDILCGVDDGDREDDFTADKKNSYYGWDESSGRFSSDIKKDILEGVLVAYVVKTKDNNINKPISRLLIKPYVNEKNSQDIIWVSADKLYGQSIEGFQYSVDEWLGSWQGDDFGGLYRIKGGLYPDKKETIYISKDGTIDIEAFMRRFIRKGEWKLNENGEVDVKGDFSIYGGTFTEIPVKFGKVTGYFDCGENNLTSLKNAPSFVGGSFNCSYNKKLTDLKFAPISIGGGFSAFSCGLTSLKGFPKIVKGGTISISYNQLTSFGDYLPKKIKGSFFCDNNKLTSLVGSPRLGVTWFQCDNNNLTSLVGSPPKIVSSFICSVNNLTTLEGIPKSIGGDFVCRNQRNGIQFEEKVIRRMSKIGKEVGNWDM
jgi:hypothetical protein